MAEEPTWPKPIQAPDVIKRLAANVGGTITECASLPDGSGFAMMSMPLPKDHWSGVDGRNVPPMALRVGTHSGHVTITREDASGRHQQTYTRAEFASILREAGRYAYRAATMNGKEPDLDPDALLQNLIVGGLGYWTADGLSGDEWANP